MGHLSLFSGIGGFDLAAKAAGIDNIATCEVDAHCRTVLESQLPGALSFTDVTELTGDQVYEQVDVLTAGSPCQDFSIAGLRAGLAGSRSGLFEHVIRLRDELQPRFVVWENVLGALTSNKGEDLANVIGALVGSPEPLALPKHPNGRRSRYAGVAHGPAGTLAWRVLDAQNFGVPQRRQRIFAVLDTQGSASIEVLFPGSAGHVRYLHGPLVAPLDLDDTPFDTGMAPPEPIKTRLAEVLESDVHERYYLSQKACIGILHRANKRGRTLPPVLDYALRSQAGETVVGEPPVPVCPEVSNAVPGKRYDDASVETLVPVLMKQREGKPGGGKGPLLSPDLSLTLATGNDQLLFEPQSLSQNQRGEVRTSEVAPALSSGGGKPGQGYSAVLEPAYAIHGTQDPIHLTDTALALESRNAPHSGVVSAPPLYRVRRLTPVECERLQGFPDGWTDVEGAKDSHRYCQLGNAVAVPVATWVLDRIARLA